MTKKTNFLTGQETNFIWNAESQLVAMQIAAAGSVTKEIFFKYDGLGRRIERQVVDHLDSSKSYGRKFFYDGNMIIEEQDLNGNLVARYMNGPGIDDPLLVSRTEGNFVFTKDGLGSVRELTKSDGAAIQKYRYSSYGVTTQELQENRPDKKLIENRYAYTGREIEDETGLYYYRARYYDPELGRFLSEDPIGFSGADINIYRYTLNNPVGLTDPLGLKVDGPVYTVADFIAALATPDGQVAMNSGFIKSDIRFVYTDQGVMDMRHVQAAYHNTQSLMASGIPASLAGAATYGAGVGVELVQGTQQVIGNTQSLLSSPRSYNTDSAFSPEDIPSNAFGIGGAKQYNSFTDFIGSILEPRSCRGGY